MIDPQSPDPEFRAGDRIRTEIGEFEVQQVLGIGGMGVVYQVVRDARHGGRQFALKTILPELLNRREVIERFEVEGRVLAKFDHENIIKIDGIFTMLSAPPRPFILMELLQGYTLRYVMDQYDEPLSVNDVCTVAIGVCNALEETHKHGVVHRDIKPENIFIQKRRKHTRVVLIDFGIMKQVLGSGGGPMQTSNVFLGSYSNASPEQLLGKEVTPASDFYSLGTSLYEMLTAGPMFPGVTESRSIGQAHVDRRPIPLHERAPQVPREIADIVMQALDKDPKARPKDAHAFRQPFSTIRNRLLREQAQSAGFSTIERFLANTVGAERVPVVVSSDPVRGSTLRLPALRPEVRDTTAPSDPPCGGTQPDRGDALVRQPDASSLSAAMTTRPDRPPRPALQGLPTVVVDDSPSQSTEAALREEQILWKAPSGLAAIPIQPPVDPPGTPGTDPTSTRDLPPRPVRAESSSVERGEKDEPRARRRSLARRSAGVALGIALIIGVVDVGMLFMHAKRAVVSAEAVTATAVPGSPSVDAPALVAPVPAPLPPATPAPLPSPTPAPEPLPSASPSPAASTSASAAPPAPATRKEKEKKAGGGHAGHGAAVSTETSRSGVDLSENISESHAPRPAPSASAGPKSKVPGADF